MEIRNRFKSALAAFRRQENSVDPNAFLKYGRRSMPSTWSSPEISDEDFYTGYGFAVINKRANRSVVLGKKFLYTEAKEEIIKKANEEGVRVVHPYLELIRDSVEFAERDFWYDISTYLDLEGIYYLMAVRTVSATGKVGNIQKFVLLNPYKVRPVVNSKGELGGYVESDGNRQREIPKEMMIVIRLLNPFDPSRPYSLADAARDAQFTMKQANDFARESIDGNLNAPGIISSAIELPDDQFDNFVARIKNHSRGEPLFGNGSGTITWTDMQADLDKAALDKINSISRDTLLAVSGLSKTGVGVEESGTGREVSRTQKDDFTENAVMPQIENIIDALNLDYRRYYEEQYRSNKYSISLDNPLETDRDAEQKDVEIRQSQFDLQQSLIDKGYDADIAAKYAKGLIDITDLGEASPKDPPADPPQDPPADPPADPPQNSLESPFYENAQTEEYEGYPVPVVQYLEDLANQITPMSESGSVIYATQAHDKVRIKYIAEFYNNLIGVVDEDTYVLLGEFKNNADRVAVISRLNKRYRNQLVAVKKKIDLQHKCSGHFVDNYEITRNAAFDKQDQIDSSTSALLGSVTSVENQMLEWYLDELSKGNSNPHANTEPYINGLTLPFAVWFTVMFPIFASQRVRETAKELKIDEIPLVGITEDVKVMINEFAAKEASSHVSTIKADIENALAIIRAQTSDPTKIKEMLQAAFVDIQNRRAPLIASNAANRIFALSQYEADDQFLTKAGLIERAYKQMFSSTGEPCPICTVIINQTAAAPIPFKQAFVSVGDTIVGEGRTMFFDYEDVQAGNVHPNCNCYYKIIIKED